MRDRDAPTPETPHEEASPRRAAVEAQGAEVVDISGARKRSHAAAAAAPAGDSAPPAKQRRRKAEKTNDWGKVNELVEHAALIRGTDTCFYKPLREIWKISALAHDYGSDPVRLWKESDRRWSVQQGEVVFDPTQTCPEHYANLFAGFNIRPRSGDPAPALELVRYLTSRTSDNADECEEYMHKLLQELAYPLQHRGAKMNHAIVMHGPEGSGKSMLFEQIVMPMHAPYGRLVGQAELEDKFNDTFSKCTFVVADEVLSRQELSHQSKNRIKPLITSRTIMINPKNLPRREERNHINFVFLSNELQPLALDTGDRRYFVINTPGPRERSFYERIKAWLQDGGAEVFCDYLMRYPLDDFDPFGHAPFTQAKQDLIELGLRSAERFWQEWATGELGLPYMTCSVDQAYRAYTRYAQRTGDRFPSQENAFSALVLRAAGQRAAGLGVSEVRRGKASWDVAGRRRTFRLLMVNAPPPDRSMGQWASECVDQFDRELGTFLSSSRSLGGDAPAGGEA